MKALITGAAGFIGFHLARRLLSEGWRVTGLDGLTDYYDVALKRSRLAVLEPFNEFRFAEAMLEDMAALERAAEDAGPDVIVHLAAQAGVRHSLEAPRRYIESNLVGTFNVLEIAKAVRPRHFLHASTSSIYGADSQAPFSERSASDHPLSLYAATKKAGEAMSHAWAHLWRIPTTALRFFTVYGPWGRPDMAAFKFVEAIRAGREIEVHNGGRMERDFTFIGDLVESLVRLIGLPPAAGANGAGEIDSLSPTAPWRVVNVGGGEPVALDRFIACIEAALGASAHCQSVPMGAGEMERTDADPRLLQTLIGYTPATGIERGVRALCAWHLEHYPQGAPLFG